MLFYDRDVGTVVFYDLAPFFGFIVNDRVSLTEFPFPKKKQKKNGKTNGHLVVLNLKALYSYYMTLNL